MLPLRWNPVLHDAHIFALCVVHAVPVFSSPYKQIQVLAWHELPATEWKEAEHEAQWACAFVGQFAPCDAVPPVQLHRLSVH